MTNAESLRQIKANFDLTSAMVADLLGVSLITVHRWLLHSGSENHRAMPDSRLDHLKLIIKYRKRLKRR